MLEQKMEQWDAGTMGCWNECWNVGTLIVVVSWKDGIGAGTLERRNDGMTIVVVVVVENDDEHEILGYNKILLLLLLLRIHENLLGHWSSMD
jgi:hypothetical protein